jgi:electron transport complex protein RnfE
VLARVEAFAAKNEPGGSTVVRHRMGIGLTLVLAVLGAMRGRQRHPAVGHRHDLPAPSHRAVRATTRLPDRHPAPGAFIALGCLIAGRNWIEARKQARARANPPAPSAPADAPAEPA